MAFDEIASLPVDRKFARVYEHGWQSWSPSTSYAINEFPHRPANSSTHIMGYRPGVILPASSFQGEGLLAVSPGDGSPIHIFYAPDPATAVPSIRAHVHAEQVIVSTDGKVDQYTTSGPRGLYESLGDWAEGHAQRSGIMSIASPPTIWCSWYHYFTQVTEAAVLENLEEIRNLDLPVEAIQIDDGWQAEIGDWLQLSGRFFSLETLVGCIREQGQIAGIWLAPFLVGSRSTIYMEHPDWVVGGATAGTNWSQDLFILDITHPGADAYLRQVFTELSRIGFSFFKLDYLYAGAIEGRRHDDITSLEAYRRGLMLIRESTGSNAYLLGCGAPILPSVGLVDAMRISADISQQFEPPDGDLFRPSQRSATLSGKARAFQHGRFWVNDPDCIIANPAMQRRGEWVAHIQQYGGLRGSGDRLSELDDWGLEATRSLLSNPPPPRPFDLSAD